MRRKKLMDTIEKKVKDKKMKNVILKTLDWEEERIDENKDQIKTRARDYIKRIIDLEL